MTAAGTLEAVVGGGVVYLVLRDAFATIVIPKTVEHRFHVSTLYYRLVWQVWQWLGRQIGVRPIFRNSLVAFGPLSLIFLFGVWAGCLVVGFAGVHYGLATLGESLPFTSYIYFSGVTFFTLGYGDMAPVTDGGRFIALLHVACGYGFLAIVIGFVPTFYSFFSRRERFIVMMDSRAGSNPSAGELLRRHAQSGALPALTEWLKEAETWCAEQLEGYLSYPVLAYYRSQHEDQSWLASMTAVLDTCALVLSGMRGEESEKRALRFQAEATFAMARHVIVDLAYLLNDPPAEAPPSRLSPADETMLREVFARFCGEDWPDCFERLVAFRSQYEPYLVGLAQDLLFTLPAWTPLPGSVDHWKVTAWDHEGHF